MIRQHRPRQSFQYQSILLSDRLVPTAGCSCLCYARDAGGLPTGDNGIESSARVQVGGILICSAPHNHFTSCPDCSVIVSCSGRIVHARCCPTISAGAVLAATVQTLV